MNNSVKTVSSTTNTPNINITTDPNGGSFDLIQTIINLSPGIILSIIIIIISIFISSWAKRYIEHIFLKTGMKIEAQQLIGKAMYIIILSIGIATSLEILGLNTTFLLSALGFGLGFAFKDILSNYIAGMFLIFNDAFKLGDLVIINEYLGKIEEIGYRNIILRNLDGNRVFIPNSLLINGTFINLTYYPERRLIIPINISYREDMQKASKAIMTVLTSHPKILKKPEPEVHYNAFDSYSLIVYAKFWISSNDNFMTIQSEVITDIKFIFDKLHIVIPFPITTINSEDRYGHIKIENNNK